MSQVKDLQADVKRKLSNRTDAYDLAPYWIRDAVRELTDNYSFEELKEEGPPKALTTNVAKYNITDFMTPSSNNFTQVEAIELFSDYPTNTVSKMLKYRELMVVLPMARINGLPSVWSRFGSKFVIANMPNNPYTAILYYQRKHAFDESSLDALRATTIFMPDSWLEIVVLSAAERGAIELRIPDLVTLHHSVLFGDPANAGQPGLIQARISQHQKDKGHNEGQITPQVQRYT